uniref:Secreted protein n=1 Tax=Heterorhabditis bacteriophora TaxID=37862 RepID=A0A1I7X8T0_HETBA
MLQFLVYFVNFVAVLLYCAGFARIQVVVNDSTCRPSNSDHILLLVHLRFKEVFWDFTSVQPLDGTPLVVVKNPLLIICHNAIKKWVVFVAQEKRRAYFVTAIF